MLPLKWTPLGECEGEEKKCWKELNVRLDGGGQKLEREREEHRTIEGRRERKFCNILLWVKSCCGGEKSLFLSQSIFISTFNGKSVSKRIPVKRCGSFFSPFFLVAHLLQAVKKSRLVMTNILHALAFHFPS